MKLAEAYESDGSLQRERYHPSISLAGWKDFVQHAAAASGDLLEAGKCIHVSMHKAQSSQAHITSHFSEERERESRAHDLGYQ